MKKQHSWKAISGTPQAGVTADTCREMSMLLHLGNCNALAVIKAPQLHNMYGINRRDGAKVKGRGRNSFGQCGSQFLKYREQDVP